MRKFVFVFAVSLFILPFAASASVPEAVTYLKTQPQDDWITQALVAAGNKSPDKTNLKGFSGSSATNYAKRIMAIVAVGENPRTYTGADLVQGLKDLAQGGQLGDPSLLNDDAWGIMALRAAGVAASDSVVSGAENFLLTNQNADGGWGYATGVGSDTNDTAAVLMALADVGKTSADTAVASAIAYLATQQTAEAGFAYQLPCSWPGCDAADSASTSWVVSALAKLGANPATWVKGSTSPLDFLLGLQTPDGSFKWQAADSVGSAGMTAYAVVALSGRWYPVPPLARSSGGVGGGGQRIEKADLSLSVTVPPGEHHPGDSVTYTITLQNLGPDSATDILVRGAVLSGVNYDIAQTTAGTFDPSGGTWSLNALSAGSTAEAQVTVTLPVALGEFVGHVQVSSNVVDAGAGADPKPQNNQAELKVTSVAEQAPRPTVLGAADVSCNLAAATVAQVTESGFVLVPSGEAQELWYLDPVTREAACAEGEPRVRPLLEKFALGITNANLNNITPGSPLAERLRSRILLQVESLGEAWYVGADGTRTYLPPTAEAFAKVRSLAPVALKQ